MAVKLDASPWGLGAWLLLNGRIVAWLSSALSAEDEAVFGHAIGESAGQQT